jgi:hypothetical protein
LWNDAIEAAVSEDKFKKEDVAEVFKQDYGENEGPPAVAIGRLKDGRFFAFSAWRDYTGFG